jgi:hypothetical protein
MTWKAIQTATSNNVDKEADLSSCKQWITSSRQTTEDIFTDVTLCQ